MLGRLDDVARYLSRHRVEGRSRVMVRQEGSGAAQLIEIAQEERADLVLRLWNIAALANGRSAV